MDEAQIQTDLESLDTLSEGTGQQTVPPPWLDCPANADPYLRFWLELLQTSYQQWGQQQPVWQFCAQNLAALNLGLIPAIQTWFRQNLPPSAQRDTFVGLVENVVIYIQQFAFGNRPVEYQQIAVAGYTLVLQVRTLEKAPEKRAQTLNNRGNAYLTQAQLGVEPVANLQRAIQDYGASAEILRRLNLERDLSSTLNNRGTAYLTQAQLGVEPVANLQRAIQDYRTALRYFNPAILPVETLKTGRALGNVGFKEGDWDLAIEGYTQAINAVETSRSWATTDERRREILEKAIGIYDNALQCYINLGQYDQAILLTERARSRHLVELMATADTYDATGLPPDLATYLQQYEDLQTQINRLQNPPKDSGNLAGSTLGSIAFPQETLRMLKSRDEEIVDLQARKRDIWEQIRKRDPILAGEKEVTPLPWDDLTHLLADLPTTALLSFYSTNDHTHILILRQPTPNPSQEGNDWVTVHTCENQGYTNLQTWLRDQWFEPYKEAIDAYFRKDYEPIRQWRAEMDDRLEELATRLDLNTLIDQHLQGIDELILIPHIFLHLIPFAALPLSSSPRPWGERSGVRDYLSDRFRLRVLPSANILKYCHDRENSPTAPTVPFNAYGSVEGAGDPSRDRSMAIARNLFEPIAQSLKIPNTQRLLDLQATSDRYYELIKNPQVQAVHSIHHASAQLSDPLNSSLHLADGTITLAQLMSYPWRMPQMQDIFLAACETNLGTPNINDDILTLGAGFLCAGARSVVSTLWSVDALANSLFCEFYYYERQLGHNRPTALHNAQVQLRTQTISQLRLSTSIPAYLTQLQQEISDLEAQGKDLYNDWKQKGEPTEHPYHDFHKLFGDLITSKEREHKRWTAKDSQEQPFESPYYWSAFILQGLR
ncbi:MAG: CHAT domain-containing protein [Prochlorotrichaceae cyanobacterium]